MHDLHVIQGPNVTRDDRERIAFFAFHAFVVEDSRSQQNRVGAKLYNCGACVCKSNVEDCGLLLSPAIRELMIAAAERLTVTLRFLATGVSSFVFRERRFHSSRVFNVRLLCSLFSICGEIACIFFGK